MILQTSINVVQSIDLAGSGTGAGNSSELADQRAVLYRPSPSLMILSFPPCSQLRAIVRTVGNLVIFLCCAIGGLELAVLVVLMRM